ncbi:MAG: ubiquitin carboxyl-terminal hydrolase [Chlamydiae bacterium]|nr:ubiquitin carboxyl-terminal hydrolase [Chlamydiota bacterium]
MSVVSSSSYGIFNESPRVYSNSFQETPLSNYVGQILILGSSFSTIAILVCSVVVSPWFAPLLVGVVAMAILGVKLIENEPEPQPIKQKVPPAPQAKRQHVKAVSNANPRRRGFDSVIPRIDPKAVLDDAIPRIDPKAVLGDAIPRIDPKAVLGDAIPRVARTRNAPIGLSNQSNNCWANSCLQFLMNIPTYRDAILSGEEDTLLKKNMKRYLRAQEGRETSRVNTQEIRSFLSSSQRTHIHRSAGRQEDVSEALEYIFDEAGLYNDVSEAFLGQVFHEVQRASPFVGLSLANSRENAPFIPHMAQYFNFLADGHLRRRKFTGDAPSDFIVKQERFYREDIRGTTEFIQGKHMQKIDVPLRYELPAEYTTNGIGPTEYECDAFITHIGPRINSGHYVAFVKKQDETGRVTYWKCNDSHVSEISETKFVSEMKDAYFLHFKKV